MATQRRNGIDRFNVATALTDDRKFITFKRALKTDEAHAYLYLVRFFAYMAQNRAFNPQLSPDEADIVADFCYFTDEPASLIVALQIAGFLTTDLTVSGWFDHQPLAELLVKKAEAGSKGGHKTAQTHQPDRGTDGKFQPKPAEAQPKQNDFSPKHNGQSTEANAIFTEANSEPLIPNSEPLTPNQNAFPSFPPTPNGSPTNREGEERQEGKAVMQTRSRLQTGRLIKRIDSELISSCIPTLKTTSNNNLNELEEWCSKFESLMQEPSEQQRAQIRANLSSCIRKNIDLYPIYGDLENYINDGNATSPNGLIISRLMKEIKQTTHSP